MNGFPVHTVGSAPADSKALLQSLQDEIGMIPNLAASMAESPELLQGFLTVRGILERGTFRPGEVQVLALTNAFENGCRYCMALHSTFALSVGVSEEAVRALREGANPDDARLGPLSALSRALVRRRGKVRPEDLETFLRAGYSRRQALEVVLQVAASIMPNFSHQLTGCPVDSTFAAQAWESRPEEASARVQ
jgi:AhpD family alkylhydroperoxidase